MPGIPVSLVCGFLGSGKTTLLKRIAEEHTSQKFLFLVNEFASEGVDPALLEVSGFPVISVVGGSLFCQCKVGDFIAHLKKFAAAFESGENSWDHLIIETSGLADPTVIHRLFRETGLDKCFEVERIICVVFPKRYLAVCDTLPVVSAQIQSATHIIINKLDLCCEQDVLETETRIRRFNATAGISRSLYCETFDFTVETETSGLSDGVLSVRPNPFSTRKLSLPDALDPAWLARQLDSLGHSIYRAKGFIFSSTAPGSLEYFDWTPEEWKSCATEAAPLAAPFLVLLFNEEDSSMERKIDLLESGR